MTSLANLSNNELQVYNSLTPECQSFFLARISQETDSIISERSKLKQAMNEEIANMKHRLLYKVCNEIRDDVNKNDRLSEIKSCCPDLFVKFPNLNMRKRMKNKLKGSKQNVQETENSHKYNLTKLDVLKDLNLITTNNDVTFTMINKDNDDDKTMLMKTKGGQKWIVKKVDNDDKTSKIIYCDGSESIISEREKEKIVFKKL